MERQEYRLGDVCTLRAGSAFKKKYQGLPDGDLPFIKVSDMNLPANKFRIHEANNWVSHATAQDIGARPFPAGTVVFAKIGEALKQNRVRLLTVRTLIDNNMMGAIPIHDLVDPYYLMLALAFTGLDRWATGTAMPYLTQGTLNEVPIELPDLRMQRKVAALVTAYDELIENNLQRIQILEEMAQAVYREWFVNFRFPGHEDVALVDSPLGPIPEGWEVVTMSDFTTTQYGYTASTEEQPIGPKFLRGMDFNKRPWIDWSEVPYCPISDTDFEKYKVETGDVLVIRMADPGKVGIVEKNVDAVFASYIVRVTPDQRQALPYWLFYFMSSPAYQGYISGAGTGTTRKSASAGVLTGAKLALPAVKVQAEFVDAITPLRRLLNNLIDQNANLRTTRDLLLPKLVSGEIDVSDLEIDTEWLAS